MTAMTAAQRRRRKMWKLMKRYWRLYVMLLLPVIYLILFKYVPMAGVQIAFRKYNMRDGIWGSKWVGMKNIQKCSLSTSGLLLTHQLTSRMISTLLMLQTLHLVLQRCYTGYSRTVRNQSVYSDQCQEASTRSSLTGQQSRTTFTMSSVST